MIIIFAPLDTVDGTVHGSGCLDGAVNDVVDGPG